MTKPISEALAVRARYEKVAAGPRVLRDFGLPALRRGVGVGYERQEILAARACGAPSLERKGRQSKNFEADSQLRAHGAPAHLGKGSEVRSERYGAPSPLNIGLIFAGFGGSFCARQGLGWGRVRSERRLHNRGVSWQTNGIITIS